MLKKKPVIEPVDDSATKKELAALTKALTDKDRQLAIKLEENLGMKDLIDR
jgi:hypothetical protein